MSNLNPYSQLNKSPAKALYSFAKSNRPSMAKKLYCDSFYDMRETKSYRKASIFPFKKGIGYGKKVNWDVFTKPKLQIPAPGTYTATDFATANQSHHKGFSISVGRQQTKNSSFVQFDKAIPGPQRYHVEVQKQGPKYTLRPRTASQTFVKSSSKLIPGPGRYDPLNSINPQGRYNISKWESSKAARFNPKSSNRFLQTSTFDVKLGSSVPGPGKYTPRNSTLIDNGYLTESRYTSSGNRVFATGNRSTIFEEEPKRVKDIPGPGMYQSFSDFGSFNWLEPKKFTSTIRPSSSRLNGK